MGFWFIEVGPDSTPPPITFGHDTMHLGSVHSGAGPSNERLLPRSIDQHKPTLQAGLSHKVMGHNVNATVGPG